jgi:Kef-type K+ transport system membrane component KefB
MDSLFKDASLWFLLILISSLISFRLGITTALIEILIGIIFGNIINIEITEWVKFLSSVGAVVLTFLAGAELETEIVKKYWKESTILGLMGFLAPFIGATLISYYLLKWNLNQSFIAGLALSTTSVAVVYSVMFETKLNETELGKLILAACFVTDLGTVITLGLIFTKFDLMFWIFVIVMIILSFILPKLSKVYFEYVKNHSSEPEVKFILFILILLGFLAIKGGSEAVLPAYIVGALLADNFLANKEMVKRLRVLTISFLTPFYFIKAGILVDLKSVISYLPLVIFFLFVKTISKFIGLYPLGMLFKFPKKVNIYINLLMSTGLTFGTICALYGLNKSIIDKNQYSILVVVVILTAIIPTIIAQLFFQPKKNEVNFINTKNIEKGGD